MKNICKSFLKSSFPRVPLCSSFPKSVIGNPVLHRFLACTLSLLLALSPLTTALAADTKRSITLTTYYPAPFGSYERVQTGKGVTPASPGDIAIQRQLRVGKDSTASAMNAGVENFGQNVINLDVTDLDPLNPGNQLTGMGYRYNPANNYLYYDTANDSFARNYSEWDNVVNGLPLDIAVGGHTRISGQGKAAIAGYLDVLPWDDPLNPPDEPNFGGEMAIRGAAGDPNWAMRVYNGEWHLVADVGSPYQAFTGNPTTGPTERFKFDNNGNMYVGKMYGDNGKYDVNKIDMASEGALFIGNGAIVRYKKDNVNAIWNAGTPTNPGIYSIDDTPNLDMNFVNKGNTSAFKWYSEGMNGNDPFDKSDNNGDTNLGLEMTLNSSDGLTINQDGLWVKGVHDTVDGTINAADGVGFKVDKRSWLNGNVGIGGEPDENYALKVFEDGAEGDWGAEGERDVLFQDDLLVEDSVAIGFDQLQPPIYDQDTGLYVLKDVEVGNLPIAGKKPATGEGNITAKQFVMSVDGDFFSKNGALVRYDSSSAPSFNPINPGLYSNDSNLGEGVMNFVTNQNDFKWYGKGYKNNLPGESGIVGDTLPMMVLNPGGDSDYGKGLTITPEGGGLRVRGKLKATADMPGLWVDNETVLAKTTVIGGNLTNLPDDLDTLFFDESKSILVIPDNSDNNNVYMGDNLVVKDRVVVGGGLTDEPENAVALQVKKSAEIDGTLVVGEMTSSFDGTFLTDKDLAVKGSADILRDLQVQRNAVIGSFDVDSPNGNTLTVLRTIKSQGFVNDIAKSPELVLDDSSSLNDMSITLSDLESKGATLNFDFAPPIGGTTLASLDMRLDQDGNLAVNETVAGKTLAIAKESLRFSSDDTWGLNYNAGALQFSRYKTGTKNPADADILMNLQTNDLTQPQMTVYGEISSDGDKGVGEPGLRLGVRSNDSFPKVWPGLNQWSIYTSGDNTTTAANNETGILTFRSDGATSDVLTLTDTGNLTALNTVTGNKLKIAQTPFDLKDPNWNLLLDSSNNLVIRKEGDLTNTNYLKAWDDTDAKKLDVQNLAVSSTGKVQLRSDADGADGWAMALDGAKLAWDETAVALTNRNMWLDSSKLWVKDTADVNALEVGGSGHLSTPATGRITVKDSADKTMYIATRESANKAVLNFSSDGDVTEADSSLQIGGDKFVKAGNLGGASPMGSNGPYNSTAAGLHVFGGLLIGEDALSDESVTSADIKDGQIKAIDMVNDPSVDVAQLHSGRIIGSVPGLNSNYLQGYTAADFMNTDSVKTGGCGFYRTDVVPHGDIKGCITDQLFGGNQATSITVSRHWEQAKFCYNVTDANQVKWKAIVHVDVAQNSYRGATFIVVKNQECLAGGGGGPGGGEAPDDTNWIDSADIMDGEVYTSDIHDGTILGADINAASVGAALGLGLSGAANSLENSALQQVFDNIQQGSGITLSRTNPWGPLTIAASGGAAAGVSSLSSDGGATKLKGDITLTAGSNITITSAGNDIAISADASGGGGGEASSLDAAAMNQVKGMINTTDWTFNDADLVTSAVGNDEIAISAVQGGAGGGRRSIKIQSITGALGGDIMSETITGWNIQDGTIDARDLVPQTDANALTGMKIKDGSIDARDLVLEGDANALTGANVINGTIYGANQNGGVGPDNTGASDIDFQTITNWNIKPGTLSGDNLAGDSVESRHIVEYAVRGDMADGVAWSDTGDNGEIAPDTITGWNIKDQTITGEMADGIPDNALGGDIAPATITGWNIAGDAITTSHIAPGAVKTADIEVGAVTGAYNPVTGFLAAGNSRIATETVGSENIKDGSIKGIDITKLDVDALTGENIQNQTVYGVWNASGINDGLGELALGTIGSENIKDHTVYGVWNASGLNDGLGELASGTIGSENIRNESIMAADLDMGSITGALLTEESVTSFHIKNMNVKGAEAAPGTGDIAPGTITGWNIKDHEIRTLQLNQEVIDLINAVSIGPGNILPNTVKGGKDILTSHIQQDTVTGWNIENGTIHGGGNQAILNDSGATGEIGYETITGWNILNNSLTVNDLGPAVINDIAAIVGSIGLPDNSVHTNNIANEEVYLIDLNQEVRNAINNVLAPNKVTGAWNTALDIEDIANSHIKADTITGWNIKDGKITSADLEDTDVTGAIGVKGAAQGGDGTGDIAKGTITGWNIQDTSIKGDDLNIADVASKLQIDALNWVTSDNIQNNAIKLIDLDPEVIAQMGAVIPNSVDSAKIVDLEVVGAGAGGDGTGDIAGETITGWNIKNGTIKGGGSNFLASGDIDMETITGWNLAPNSVTTDKIANGEVGPDDLADDSVNSAKIANLAVRGAAAGIVGPNSSEIALDTIYGGTGPNLGNIAPDTITAWNLATDSVDNAEIIAGAVRGRAAGVASEIALDTIYGGSVLNEGNIATDTITGWNIANQTIRGGAAGIDINVANTSEIALETIIGGTATEKGNIAFDTITSWNIKDEQIEMGDLSLALQTAISGVAPNSVGTNEIVNGSLTNDDISLTANIVGTKIAKDTITGGSDANLGNIAYNTITSWNISNLTIKGADGGDGTGDIQPNTITGWNILNGSIKGVDIANLAITAVKLDDLAVETDKLADLAVTTDKLAGDAVTSDKIFDGTVSSDDIANGTIQEADFSLDLINSLVFNTNPLVRDLDGNNGLPNDVIDRADAASYLVINDGGVKKKCKVKKVALNYLTGLNETPHADSETVVDGGGGTITDDYYTYTVNNASQEILVIDTDAFGAPICSEPIADWAS